MTSTGGDLPPDLQDLDPVRSVWTSTPSYSTYVSPTPPYRMLGRLASLPLILIRGPSIKLLLGPPYRTHTHKQNKKKQDNKRYDELRMICVVSQKHNHFTKRHGK